MKIAMKNKHENDYTRITFNKSLIKIISEHAVEILTLAILGGGGSENQTFSSLPLVPKKKKDIGRSISYILASFNFRE